MTQRTRQDALTTTVTQRLARGFERHRTAIWFGMLVITLGALFGYVHGPLRETGPTPSSLGNAATKDSRTAAGATGNRVAPRDSSTSPAMAPAPLATEPAPASLPARQFDQMVAECALVVQGDDLFSAETIAALRDVAESVQSLDQVARVLWADDVPELTLSRLGQSVLPPPGASAASFQQAQDRVKSHPMLGGQLVSRDGKTLLMMVWLEWIHVTRDEMCTDAIVGAAREAAARHSQTHLQIRLTGRVPLYLGAQGAIHKSHLKFQLIGYSLVLVLAILLFRGISAVIIVAGAPALGVFWSIGWLRLFDQLDNPLTGVVLPVLISMVGFTDGVHLIVHIRTVRAAGATPMQAAKSAIEKVGLACWLTSLTTAIGFGSLMLASNEYVQGFGRACAIAVLLTFVAVITFIPLISTTWLGRNVQRGHEKDFVGNNLTRLTPLVDTITQYRWALSALGTFLTLFFGWFALSLHPDERLSDSQPADSEAYQALQHCDVAFQGTELVQIRLDWRGRRLHDTDAIMEAIAAAEAVLEAEPLIQNELSIRGLLRELPGAETTAGRSAYLALLPNVVRELYYDSHRRHAFVTGRIQDKGIATYQPVFVRIEQALVQLRKDHEDFGFHFAGSPVSRSKKLFSIVTDLATSLSTASFIILVVLAIVYRSLRVGLITIVPNILPLAVTATYLVCTGKPLEIASVCSFTVCLGIAVDDSIHFLTRYQDERQSGKDGPSAVRATFIGVGTAMITTTVVLICGFGTVMTSDLPGHRIFAAMACWTISTALVGDLIFLPAMLLCFDGGAQENCRNDEA